MDLVAGALVTDKVRLVEPLGEGSMGVVWVAEHLTLKTRVAVKFLSARLSQEDPIALARFEREACASAQVKSPHVVQTFDHGLHASGRPYIVMELLEGQNLVERLHARGPLELDEVALIIEHIGHALSAAHKLGIIHRDVKPGNVFLLEGAGFFCKLLDFGVAKPARVAQVAGITESGSLLGTPEFMSPEQLVRPQAVGASTDLWALAATAYAALTDYVPFEATTLGELCVKILNAEFEPPSGHRELPPAIDRWFERALHREPGMRFPDAESLAASFRRAMAGEDFEPVPASAERTADVPTSARRRVHDEPATFSGSASDARVLRPRSRAPLWAALGALTITSATVSFFVLDEAQAPSPDAAATEPPVVADPPSAPAPAAEPAPPLASSVEAPPSAVATANIVDAPPFVAPRRPNVAAPPAPSPGRHGAAPGDPGF